MYTDIHAPRCTKIDLELANKMDGTLHQVHESLSLIALRQGDHNEAVRRFTRLLRLRDQTALITIIGAPRV
jgi:Flp pilus assembly protein TadD